MLDSDEVRADERGVLYLVEHTNNPGVINARNENGEEISQKCGLFLEVERQRFVVAIGSYQSIRDANNP